MGTGKSNCLRDPGSGIGEEMCQQMSAAQDGHSPWIAAVCGGSLGANETTHLSRLGDYVHLKTKVPLWRKAWKRNQTKDTVLSVAEVLTSSRRE